MRNFWLILFVILSASAFSGGVEAFEVARGGKSNVAIVTGDSASPTIVFAAEELAFYIGKISGSVPEISTKAVAGKNSINLLKVNDAKLGKEGYSWKIMKNSVSISANTPRGILYGAFAFIRRELGVRWFAPGDDYEYCPKSENISIKEGEFVSVPHFEHRAIQHVYSLPGKKLDTWNWIVRNGMQLRVMKREYSAFRNELEKRGAIVYEGGHTLNEFVSDSLISKKPEYFALVKGKRIPQIERGKHGRKWLSQPCLSNPEVIKMVTDGVSRYFENDPKVDEYLIGNNDVPVWCECDACTKEDVPSEREKGIVTTRFYRFINKVTSEIHKRHPEARLYAWAYQTYQEAPKGVVPDKKLNIKICDHYRCYRHSLADTSCVRNERFRKIFRDWGKFGNKLIERGYQETLLDCMAYFYVPVERVIVDDILYFRKNGVAGYEYLISPPDGKYRESPQVPMDKARWRCLWQSVYLCAAFLWNAESDYDAIYEDIGSKYYLEAWPEMKKYRSLLTRLYSETPGHIVYLNSPLDLGRSLVAPGAMEKLKSHLAAAEASAKNNPVALKRVREDALYFKLLWEDVSSKYQAAVNSEIYTSCRNGKVTVDGKLDEDAWRNAPEVSDFIVNKNHTKGKLAKQTVVKVLFDRDNIYFGIEGMEDSPSKLLLKQSVRDNPDIWKDNGFEIFIADPAAPKKLFAQFIINSKDVVYDTMSNPDTLARDIKFNARIESKTRILPDRVVAEIRVPKSIFKARPYANGPWYINICRNRRLSDGINELSSWSDGRYGIPEAFNPVFEIIGNGSFEYEENAMKIGKWTFCGGKKPSSWGIDESRPGNIVLVREDNAADGVFLRFNGGIHQKLILPENYRDDLGISFRTRGKGPLGVMIYLYDRKSGRFTKSVMLKSVRTAGGKEWKTEYLAYPVKDDFILRLAFVGFNECDLDDVVVKRIPKSDLLR